MGDFGIGYQAFCEYQAGMSALTLVAADTVTDEDLGGGKFQGLVGLACKSSFAAHS